MRYTTSALLVAAPLVAATASSKRGLCVVSTETTSDDAIWTNNTDLTWYYNYAAVPTPDYKNKLNFVPMLWGAPEDPANDMTFYNTVSNLVSEGQNITYVLGFNEPDGCTGGYGGSCVSAATAAQVWKKQMEPLKRDFGIKLGAPAVTGATTGFNWLQNFFTECAALVNSSDTASNTTSCEVDFIPAHWYGNFEGLASHLGQLNSTYENISAIWVTEFACADCSLEDSQTFANQSFEYLDRIPYMQKYSYFGAFRSSVSNVGPNAAFLTEKGKLTDIGAMYLNKASTGAVPHGSASTVAKFAGWSGLVAATIFWSIL
ncbi:hypothetical protein E4T42_02696 [Aureobasidium subglaciale]|uniref:Glycoside hydrolase family 128 protein n=1 Tax=Aureobasidium subglaciale (strain EXF-2481) TaxID=1043005 RepID=A0A074YP21_AURSE|nr:glycoside hydrolase family 128 protein [Aureobasidium subglaciale EXF-2481]KAI5206187.1 hypothetical protein E4T38_03838 [Aureobasidium subglaciale]KAI5225096.1 hypothetical protein E4T40_03613 [Aureobasidium subglaciale]KAI5228630.1 hypothetical protein E4T41_03678 [Aureobasidium subglaciale]KAI5253726.1 hypothetical protein E4T42_02696 [Aureobasidium subglaciale]KAI5263721.1 hypothetical protein E4T46_03454 [Aureobasidium subglaciale]